jgi:hypothetical protein
MNRIWNYIVSIPLVLGALLWLCELGEVKRLEGEA